MVRFRVRVGVRVRVRVSGQGQGVTPRPREEACQLAPLTSQCRVHEDLPALLHA